MNSGIIYNTAGHSMEEGECLARRDKLIEAMRNNPQDVRFEDINNVLSYYGFVSRIKGSHYTYSHQDLPGVQICIPKARPVKAIYVKEALKWIDTIREEWGNED